MKQLIRFLIVLALAGAAPVQADVLLYQVRSTSRNVGEGVEFSYSTRGYIVWNLENQHLTWISYSGRGSDKFYGVSDGEPLVVSAAGASGRQFTTFSGAGENDGRYFQNFNRGLDQVLKHRTGQAVRFPRTFKGQSHTIVTSIGPRLTDNTHTMVYSPKRTIAANDAGQTEDAIVASLRAELEAQGYTDLNLASSQSEPATGSRAVVLPSLMPSARTSMALPASARK